jgi:hypothetical protein
VALPSTQAIGPELSAPVALPSTQAIGPELSAPVALPSAEFGPGHGLPAGVGPGYGAVEIPTAHLDVPDLGPVPELPPVEGSAYTPPRLTGNLTYDLALMKMWRYDLAAEQEWAVVTHGADLPRNPDGGPMPADAVLTALLTGHPIDAAKRAEYQTAIVNYHLGRSTLTS